MAEDNTGEIGIKCFSMGQPTLFIFVLSNTNFTEKIVGSSRIQTQIIADHLTTTTAPK